MNQCIDLLRNRAINPNQIFPKNEGVVRGKHALTACHGTNKIKKRLLITTTRYKILVTTRINNSIYISCNTLSYTEQTYANTLVDHIHINNNVSDCR